MHPFQDLTGQRFGRLVVQRQELPKTTRKTRWECLCDCGNSKTIAAPQLKFGTKSCGCITKERGKAMWLRHGKSQSTEYRIWRGMMNRCKYKSLKHYNNYGGRGIRVCDRWLESFEDFLADMGERPSGYSLDRIDNNGDYEPANCRWASTLEQHRNTRRTIFVTLNGERRALSEVCEKYGVDYGRTYMRVKKGWPLEKALAVPNQARSA